MKKQKFTDMQKCQANALENNIGGFTDPELWEKVKELYGGITKENRWDVWSDYWKAMGEKGSRRHGKFEVGYEYTKEEVRELGSNASISVV